MNVPIPRSRPPSERELHAYLAAIEATARAADRAEDALERRCDDELAAEALAAYQSALSKMHAYKRRFDHDPHANARISDALAQNPQRLATRWHATEASRSAVAAARTDTERASMANHRARQLSRRQAKRLRAVAANDARLLVLQRSRASSTSGSSGGADAQAGLPGPFTGTPA